MPKPRTAALLLTLCLVWLPAPAALNAQGAASAAGHWEGEIELPGGAGKLQVKVDLAQSQGAWTGTLDIPQQGGKGLALEGVAVDGAKVRFTLAGVQGRPTFEGTLEAGELRGTFTQAGVAMAFRLGREAAGAPKRPQEPAPPYPYASEEVTYHNGEVTLAGTLTLPPGDGPFPAVVLLTGSGAQDRDELALGHKPFLVLADHLTRRGIAVLRADDRGVGGSSGSMLQSTFADFAQDALAGVDLLRRHPKIAKDRVGLLGHSEGGAVAPLAAGRSADVAFVVLLAGPAVPGDEVVLGQLEVLAKAGGESPEQVAARLAAQRDLFAALRSDEEPAARRARIGEAVKAALAAAGQTATDAIVAAHVASVDSPWYRSFLDYDPRPDLRKTKVPVLALNGELDTQVLVDQNLPAIEKALKEAGNRDVTIRRLPGLNHLFQPAKTGSMAEYPEIETTLAPEVLSLVSGWIEERFAKPALAAAGGAEGHWEGAIDLPGGVDKLRVKIDLAQSAGGWQGSIDIPQQGAAGLPLEGVAVDGAKVRFTIAGIPGQPTFDGTLAEGTVSGTFSQSGMKMPFRLGRDKVEEPKRVQEPEPPFPYASEEVTYTNGSVKLAGTLTLPPGDGPFPAVVLITGSGPEDRDETVFGHKPFWILADHLSRRGVAVLRADDRGVGGSTGNVTESTTADFAQDALAGVELLRRHPKIAKDRVGLLGHSEGGLAAPLAAGRSADVAFLVLLAGPGVPGWEVLNRQIADLSRVAGATPEQVADGLDTQRQIYEVLRSAADQADRRARIGRLIKAAGAASGQTVTDDLVAAQLAAIDNPWFRFFLDYDPRPDLRKTKVPVLALNGELDLQVAVDQNLPEIEKALKEGGNPDVTVRRLPGLNHLFQPAKTGSLTEYSDIEVTVAPEVLALISDWITARFVKPRS